MGNIDSAMSGGELSHQRTKIRVAVAGFSESYKKKFLDTIEKCGPKQKKVGSGSLEGIRIEHYITPGIEFEVMNFPSNGDPSDHTQRFTGTRALVYVVHSKEEIEVEKARLDMKLIVKCLRISKVLVLVHHDEKEKENKSSIIKVKLKCKHHFRVDRCDFNSGKEFGDALQYLEREFQYEG